jgi:hypothetical protein
MTSATLPPSGTRRRTAIFVAALLFASAACRGKHSRTTVENEEPEGGPRIASSLKMNDPAAAQQLLKGFYGLEGGSWRWTARQFTAILRPPLAAAQRGGALTLSFSIPDVVIQKLSSVTLTGSVAGTKVNSETYSKPGAYTFMADVPAALLTGDAVSVDFALDKALPASPADQRELGIIATAVGLEAR